MGMSSFFQAQAFSGLVYAGVSLDYTASRGGLSIQIDPMTVIRG